MSGVRLLRLQFRYPETEALAVDIPDFLVQAGEFVAVMGESGAGKTTLLRLIAGLERPDRGEIYIGGASMNDVPVGRRPVQLIFQSLALWPHLRVMDERGYSNLSLPLRVRRWTAAQIAARVGSVSRRVGLKEELYSRKPDQLSGGERQRVALARAMVTEAETFLMDEPLSSLDPISRPKMRAEVRRLHDELGATTLYVTHSIADARAMADRIAVLRDGASSAREPTTNSPRPTTTTSACCCRRRHPRGIPSPGGSEGRAAADGTRARPSRGSTGQSPASMPKLARQTISMRAMFRAESGPLPEQRAPAAT